MGGNFWIIIVMLAMIGVTLLVFRIIDAMLKSSKPTKAKEEEKEPNVKSAPAVPPESAKEIKEIKEIKQTVTVRSTRSLADEIEKAIKEDNEAQINPGNYRPPASRIHSYDRIKKYREARNYVEYGGLDGESDPAEIDADGIEPEPAYSREEYKKMMALLSKPVSNP